MRTDRQMDGAIVIGVPQVRELASKAAMKEAMMHE
jgi:hypothetical protein